MIVYAGQSSGNLNDIWKLDSDTYTWTNLTPTVSPSSRRFAGLDYLGNGDLIMHGGIGSSALSDMWKFNMDTQTWTSIPLGTTKPSARSGHSLVYIPALDKLYLFGGVGTGSTKLGDTWVFENIVSGINNSTNNSELQFSVYPNPFNSNFTINLHKNSSENLNIKLFDLTGNLVLEKNVSSTASIGIDENVSPGIYILNINVGETSAYQKLIKE